MAYNYSSGLANNLGQIVQGINSSSAAQAAASAGVAGVNNGINSVTGLYGQTTALNAPFINSGSNAAGTIAGNAAGATSAIPGAVSGLQNTASGQGLNVSQFYDPSMAFTLQQGTQALQRSQAASGGVLSGAALKNLTGYAEGVASQNYQSAVTNALAEQSQQASANTNLLSAGETANSQLTPILNAGTSALGYQNTNAINTGSQLAQLNSNAGQLQAQGITQSAGGLNSAIGGAASAIGKYVNSNSGNSGNSNYSSKQAVNTDNQYYNSYLNSNPYSDEATKTNIEAITPFSAAMTAPGAGSGTSIAGAPPILGISSGSGSSSSGSSGGGGGGSSTTSILSSIGGLASAAMSFFSDEDTKTDMKPMSTMSDKDVNKSLHGMNAKSYDYTPEAQKLGAPAGKQVGIIAQDVEKTPAKGMVVQGDKFKKIDIPKATSFLLAAHAVLDKRLASLESKKGGKA